MLTTNDHAYEKQVLYSRHLVQRMMITSY